MTNSTHNHEMNLAWQLVANTNTSVFLTGKAGTGKTTFLRRLRELSPKRMVVLAPTGVAAINAEGQTIHSFFQLPFGPIVPDYGIGQSAESREVRAEGGKGRGQAKKFRMSQDKKNLIKTLDLLVIDEISMVRCDLLDAIDKELRKYKHTGKPFGGVQLLLIGDLQQLAPVAKDSEWQLLKPFYETPYFFGSKALTQIDYVTVELKYIYRQQDADFIDILGKIRENRLDVNTFTRLNERYVPNFQPPQSEDWIRLTTHNRMADEYNAQMLAALPTNPQHFKAEVIGNFPETSFPADVDLVLKTGAQVMFIKNDPNPAHEYYNGKIGVVDEFTADGISVFTKEDGKNIVVPRVEWENVKYAIDPETKEIKEEVEGVFRQYPLRLAWAITVHKSQGLTFDHAVLDIHDSFAHGQTYVALSRCRTLEGMVLARPIDARSVITDYSVNAYINQELSEAQNVEKRLPQMMLDYFLSLLSEAFSFATLLSDYHYFTRVVDEHLYKPHPEYLALLKKVQPKLKAELADVSDRFSVQYKNILLQSTNLVKDEALQERIHAASHYFLNKLHELLNPVLEDSALKIGNKQIAKQYANALDALKLSFKLKIGIFDYLTKNTFSVQNYLYAKAFATLSDKQRAVTEQKKATMNDVQQVDIAEQPEDPALFEELRQLRYVISQEIDRPPFVVFSDKTLHAIAAIRPKTREEFLLIFGIGENKANLYAERFIEVIKNYRSND